MSGGCRAAAAPAGAAGHREIGTGEPLPVGPDIIARAPCDGGPAGNFDIILLFEDCRGLYTPRI